MTTTEVNPSGVVALGKTKVAVVTTIAAGSGIPTTAELAAAGAGNLSFYIPGSELGITGNQNTGQDVRLGSVQVFDVLGQSSYAFDDIQYVVDPQTPGSTTAAGLLTENSDKFIVVRYGILATTDWTVADKVDIYPVTLGIRWKSKTSADEFGKFTYTQKVVVRSTAVTNAALIA